MLSQLQKKPILVGTYRTTPLPARGIPDPPALNRPNAYSHVKSKVADYIQQGQDQLKK